MNAYNPLASMKRLEDAGVPRSEAKAIASEISGFTDDLVTKDWMDTAFDRHTIKMSIIMAGMLTLACTQIGTLMASLVGR